MNLTLEAGAGNGCEKRIVIIPGASHPGHRHSDSETETKSKFPTIFFVTELWF